MKFKRSSGILLHPTSLPGPYGVGDLGPQAFQWVDFLKDTQTKLWQILPLGPTGYGDSPYQCFSAFAGNPYLISPEKLLEDGLLTDPDLDDIPDFPTGKVDYGWMIPWKLDLLRTAFDHFQTSAKLADEFEDFQEKNTSWLTDFALFMALKEAHGGRSWVEWSAMLRDCEEGALKQARQNHAETIKRHMFYQFLFFRQWDALRAYANKNDIKIIGDVPIYVAHDSVDVWVNPGLFFLNEIGRQTVVAGVPPDDFSDDGQLWGNPLYRWEVHKIEGYHWWIERMRVTFQTYDIIRLDHFRGFAGYWEVPADQPNAINGRWLPGPGITLFDALKNALGEMPIIAEDLGVITPDVVELLDTLGYPGMKIMPHGFDGNPDNTFHPDRYTENDVAYTGTHDNEPLVGWFEHPEQWYKDNLLGYLGTDGGDIAWEIIRSLWQTKAVYAVAQMQDFLRLGNDARMNYPSKPDGNWQWRMPPDSLDDELMAFLSEINQESERG